MASLKGPHDVFRQGLASELTIQVVPINLGLNSVYGKQGVERDFVLLAPGKQLLDLRDTLSVSHHESITEAERERSVVLSVVSWQHSSHHIDVLEERLK